MVRNTIVLRDSRYIYCNHCRLVLMFVCQFVNWYYVNQQRTCGHFHEYNLPVIYGSDTSQYNFCCDVLVIVYVILECFIIQFLGNGQFTKAKLRARVDVDITSSSPSQEKPMVSTLTSGYLMESQYAAALKIGLYATLCSSYVYL